jgi:ABC-2 type transport system ATP-binding protein
VQGLRDAALDQAVAASIERLGLDPYAGLPLRELSKGTCQKVAVAQALLAGPSLLVLDEAWTRPGPAWTRRPAPSWTPPVGERLAAGATVLFGALCNPPLIQHRGYAVMSTAAVAVAAVAAPHRTG